jgi:hypothetical protein
MQYILFYQHFTPTVHEDVQVEIWQGTNTGNSYISLTLIHTTTSFLKQTNAKWFRR